MYVGGKSNKHILFIYTLLQLRIFAVATMMCFHVVLKELQIFIHVRMCIVVSLGLINDFPLTVYRCLVVYLIGSYCIHLCLGPRIYFLIIILPHNGKNLRQINFKLDICIRICACRQLMVYSFVVHCLWDGNLHT
ncbi:hypothetical protein O6H91_17G021900 [Diphasiastrum complanatum]|uniref:Uncharacterized protein n=1 Tax=Diphasiastrum complanatum TaxID=34168 RepID=A0ACC2B4W0_DIPCM|nr:hypothetical protein O6H91_17G021900 [Diphasiastrum complanatum]